MVRNSLLVPSDSPHKTIPLEYINTNERFLAGLIDGLFSTDGDVNLKSIHPMVRLSTTSRELALAARRILLCFGIHGRVHQGRIGVGKIGDRVIRGRYPALSVNISGGVRMFADRIGLTRPRKKEKLNRCVREYALTGNTWVTGVISLEPAGIGDVYCVDELESGTWITEGYVSLGGGQQLPVEVRKEVGTCFSDAA